MNQTGYVPSKLVRPEHLDEGIWAAIEQHERRLVLALEMNDRPWIIGSAKELVESVARAVVEAKNVVVGSNADFEAVVNAAHDALSRQPGRNVSLSSEIRAIASSAKKIVLQVRDLRNDSGTGHGRAQIDAIDDEKATVVVDAAMLWVRWALRRLEHILLREADNLIAELHGAIVTRSKLRKHLEGTVLPDQPAETQRALGVAFAERAVGGTFVAREIGVDGPSASVDLAAWPAEYRFGLVEGLTLSRNGFLNLSEPWLSVIVALLAPIPPNLTQGFLRGLRSKVVEAGRTQNEADGDAHALANQMRSHGDEFAPQARQDWLRLADAVESER